MDVAKTTPRINFVYPIPNFGQNVFYLHLIINIDHNIGVLLTEIHVYFALE